MKEGTRWYESPKTPGSGEHDRYSDPPSAAEQDSSIVKMLAFYKDSASLNHSLPTVSRRKDGRSEGSKIDNAAASY